MEDRTLLREIPRQFEYGELVQMVEIDATDMGL